MSSATEEASVPETDSQTVRFGQRRRTRAAIVNATAELLRSGRTTPGVSEIAEAADVSRRAASGSLRGERPSLRCVISARLEQRARCRRSARVSAWYVAETLLVQNWPFGSERK